jgi:hypothetical protein
VVVGGVAMPSLTAYRLLFILCAVAAVLGAGIALLVPYPPGFTPLRNAQAAEPDWQGAEPPVPRPSGADETPV